MKKYKYKKSNIDDDKNSDDELSDPDINQTPHLTFFGDF